MAKNPLFEKLDQIEARLIRVESRVVQIMNHLGLKPKGALPEAKAKPTQSSKGK